MGWPILDISYKQNGTVCGLWCLASFTEHNVSKVHPCNICKYLFLFVAQYSTEWIYRILLIYSSSGGILGYSHILAITSKAPMNIHVPSVRATHIFCSLGYMAQYNRWIKWYLPSRFQQQLYHLPSHQQYFCTSYQHVISHLFDSSHPSGYKVVSHCGFDFHFPTDIEHLLVLIGHLSVFCGERSIQIFCLFLIGLS